MADNKDTWADYSKLVLKELERLNENHEKMRSDFDSKLNDMSLKLNDVKGVEKNVNINTAWIEKVNDVWSPTQMKEAKDEIYKQKSRWVATIAILTFIQIIVGIGISVWGKF
jgi:inhibitor of KinA sporulation pathway (predicted exonuclease)